VSRTRDLVAAWLAARGIWDDGPGPRFGDAGVIS